MSMTTEEFEELVQRVKDRILAESQGVGDVEVVSSLQGIVSLPALQISTGTQKVVEAPIGLLSEPAETAATEAKSAAALATEAASSVSSAKEQAISAAQNANNAASEVSESILQANSAASMANQAAQSANDAAETALSNENERVEAENKRKMEESEREIAEQSRTASESERQQNESERQTEFSSMKTSIDSAISDVSEALGNVNTAVENANNLPKIQDGTWWVWDVSSSSYVDSGTNATGRSPKIQDGTWWVWDDTQGIYINTGVSVNSTYELTKEKIENVLTGTITSHSHNYIGDAPLDDKYYGRLNGTWSEIKKGSDSVNIFDIISRLSELDGSKCSQGDYDAIKNYADTGTRTFARDGSISFEIHIYHMDETVCACMVQYPSKVLGGIATQVFCIDSELNVSVTDGSFPEFTELEKMIPECRLSEYQKSDSYSEILKTDSIYKAIGKLEAGVTDTETVYVNLGKYNIDSESGNVTNWTELKGILDKCCNDTTYLDAPGKKQLMVTFSDFPFVRCSLSVINAGNYLISFNTLSTTVSIIINDNTATYSVEIIGFLLKGDGDRFLTDSGNYEKAVKPVNITSILNELSAIEYGGKCTQELYNTVNGYISNNDYLYYLSTDTVMPVIAHKYQSNIVLDRSVYLNNKFSYITIISSDLSVSNKEIEYYDSEQYSDSLLKGYVKPDSYTSIIESDSIKQAIGKLEAGISNGSSSDFYYVPSAVLTLNSMSTSEEILEAFGGSEKRTELVNAVKEGKIIVIEGNGRVYGSAIVPHCYTIGGISVCLSFIRNRNVRTENVTIGFGISSSIRVIYANGFKLNSQINVLKSSSTSEEISSAIGGLNGILSLKKAIEDGNIIYADVDNSVASANEIAGRMQLSVIISKTDTLYSINISGIQGESYYALFGNAYLNIEYNISSGTFSCRKLIHDISEVQ